MHEVPARLRRGLLSTNSLRRFCGDLSRMRLLQQLQHILFNSSNSRRNIFKGYDECFSMLHQDQLPNFANLVAKSISKSIISELAVLPPEMTVTGAYALMVGRGLDCNRG